MESEELQDRQKRQKGDVDCNALLLPARNNKKKRNKGKSKMDAKSKAPQLSKNQRRKLLKLQEEREKKERSAQVLVTLQKYKLDESAYALLHSSGTRGQRGSMREKLRRALHFERAGLRAPSEVPLLRERSGEGAEETEANNLDAGASEVDGFWGSHNARTFLKPQAGHGRKSHESEGYFSQEQHTKQLESEVKEPTSSPFNSFDNGCLDGTNGGPSAGKKSKKRKSSLGELGECHNDAELLGQKAVSGKKEKVKNTVVSNMKDNIEDIISGMQAGQHLQEEQEAHASDLMADEKALSRKKKVEKKAASDLKNIVKNEIPRSQVDLPASGTIRKESSTLFGCSKMVVHVSRVEEVQKAREKLPIIMMEQEIMEAINENPVTIICGETGCGKTTQVPQFLYEAGFSLTACQERAGMIGVTQPRRVAVLATARRLSHEMSLKLGKEVGFQVRHDRMVGDNTRIKFMTDGILLREVQSDFLLRKYSVIVLDEAHERSLNTDVLIGMLSRILPLRQRLYEEQCRSGQPSIFPLKLVVMSATLLVDEFVANRKLFSHAPPVIQVPARQFPVTVHFSAKTELVDYVGKAYKKVCSIHKNLPPGGVLVFLTGQAEVHHLCKRLQRAFKSQEDNKEHEKPLFQEKRDLESISEAANGTFVDDEFEDELEAALDQDMEDREPDSSSESDFEFSDMENTSAEPPRSNGDPAQWNVEGSICLNAIKDAFDAFTGYSGQSSKSEASTEPSTNAPAKEKHISKEIGPLYVLPLYALLPATSQLKIFGDVPDGSRLVVVATNVAETSITIPGIRYVVDCGRVKDKVYERESGITRYEVRWISKASAAQRSGRSGRTGPGHCYRLYSSAVFNDSFPDFSQPEIYRAPIEGLVLLLKSMNIVKVNNFPFLSEPDRTALAEAEQCLHALSALDSNTGLLTPLGQAISLYPISPRHSRMFLTAMQVGYSNDLQETSILLAHTAATVAALSLESPFMTDLAPEADGLQEMAEPGQGTARKTPDLDKSIKKKGMANRRFRHPLSDALGIVGALRLYELSNDPEEFCKEHNLHARILYEMSKLRKQLIHIYVVFSRDKGTKGIPFCNGVEVADVETVWKAKRSPGLSARHEIVLRQAICAGWADRVARKVSLQELSKSKEGHEVRKSKAVWYQTCNTEENVYVHPSSSLRKSAPDFVVYNELVRTSRPYMKVLTSVDAHWLVVHACALCTFSKPLLDPPPWYDPFSDDVFCWVSPSFGAHLWQLPLHKFPLKGKRHRIAVFASALLQGKVLPGMAALRPLLAADPSSLLLPSGHAHKRASELLHVLEGASVDSRHKLKLKWDNQGDFLFQEILLWVQKKSHLQLERLWTSWKLEAQLSGKALFQTKKRQRV